MGSPLDLTW